MSLESLPFAIMILAGLFATFLFAAWALYAQTTQGESEPGWAVRTERDDGRPRRREPS